MSLKIVTSCVTENTTTITSAKHQLTELYVHHTSYYVAQSKAYPILPGECYCLRRAVARAPPTPQPQQRARA